MLLTALPAVYAVMQPAVYEAIPEPQPIAVEPEIPPILLAIAKCESSNRQFNGDGSVVRGQKNPQDVGRWQINEYWHLEEARKLGYDIYTPDGNLKMALHLYKRNGTQDWNWSRWCWDKPDNY